jgi:hypothetical protein
VKHPAFLNSALLRAEWQFRCNLERYLSRNFCFKDCHFIIIYSFFKEFRIYRINKPGVMKPCFPFERSQAWGLATSSLAWLRLLMTIHSLSLKAVRSPQIGHDSCSSLVFVVLRKPPRLCTCYYWVTCETTNHFGSKTVSFKLLFCGT